MRGRTGQARIAAAVVLLLAAGCGGSVGGHGRLASDATPAGAGTPGANGTASPSAGTLVTKKFEQREHQAGRIHYAESPPFGGNHNPAWANCTGTVYSKPVPNENAVHSLEHGAVWVTYRPGLDAGDMAALRTLVDGKDYLFLSPYPGLDHVVSVQSWGFQYKTDDAKDPGIARFITDHRQNPDTTPEYGATCSNPNFPTS